MLTRHFLNIFTAMSHRSFCKLLGSRLYGSVVADVSLSRFQKRNHRFRCIEQVRNSSPSKHHTPTAPTGNGDTAAISNENNESYSASSPRRFLRLSRQRLPSSSEQWSAKFYCFGHDRPYLRVQEKGLQAGFTSVCCCEGSGCSGQILLQEGMCVCGLMIHAIPRRLSYQLLTIDRMFQCIALQGDCATCQITLAGRYTKPCVAKVPEAPKLKSLQEKGLEIRV